MWTLVSTSRISSILLTVFITACKKIELILEVLINVHISSILLTVFVTACKKTFNTIELMWTLVSSIVRKDTKSKKYMNASYPL